MYVWSVCYLSGVSWCSFSMSFRQSRRTPLAKAMSAGKAAYAHSEIHTSYYMREVLSQKTDLG